MVYFILYCIKFKYFDWCQSWPTLDRLAREGGREESSWANGGVIRG